MLCRVSSGPAGQCVPLPDDENLKNQMSMHAINHQIIWDQYNFDYDPAPGSDMWKAQKWWKKVCNCLADACFVSLTKLLQHI